MNQQGKKIEYFDGVFLHPSLDVKNGIFILGFRFISKDRMPKDIFVVSTEKGINFYQDDNFEFKGKRYFIETKGRLLARIEEKWNLEDLINFIENYNSGKVGTPSIKEVFKRIKELLKKYVELEVEEDYSLVSTWIIGSYLFPIFSAYPFLHIKAPKGSGKTQFLNFLKQVCFNGVKAKPTMPALSDTVDSLRGTYLIDQADLLKRRGNEELVDILTDSYKKEGGKRRIRHPQKRGGWKTVEEETYSPKAFASVGELPEDLADRCITIPLIKSGENFPEPSEENENWKKIRGELYKTALTNFSLIKSVYEHLQVDYRRNSVIVGRKLELWLPIEIILKSCVEEMELGQIKKRFEELYEYTEYEPTELEKAVINTVYKIIKEGEKSEIRSGTSEIREKMDEANEDTWGDKLLSIHQKEIKIGKIIKKFNLSTKKERKNEGIVYLFQKEKVEKIKSLYCKESNNTTHSSLLPENLKILTEKEAKNSGESENLNTSL
jgi:hypothetical protein